MSTAHIYDFLEWDKDLVLIGSSKGIFVLDLNKGITARFSEKGKGVFHLPNENIYHLHQDEEDSEVIWIATGGGGLLRWTVSYAPLKGELLPASSDRESVGGYSPSGVGGEGRVLWTQYTTTEGLSSNVIYAVYEDDNQNLWLPSDYGIIRFNKASEVTETFTETDGISHNEFNRISHFEDADETLYFGGLNGVTAFHPDSISGNKENLNAPLEITAFRQFGGEEEQIIDKTGDFDRNSEIVLKPGDRFFQIEFSLLEYQDDALVRYQYKIDGQHKSWIDLKENNLQISGLPYGNFDLKIRSRGAGGQFSENELSIPIRVLKPFYLQTWFLILFGLGILTGIVFVIQRLQNQKAYLKVKVDEKTETIRQQNEELKNLDRLKSRFFANVSHELRTPLTLMLAPLENTLKNNQLTNRDFTNLLIAKRNGQQLHKMINEILDLTKLESGKLELQPVTVVWYNFLRKIIANFESLANQKNIDFQFKYSGNQYLQIKLDRKKAEIIINNLLSNAFKFTPKGGAIILEAVDEKTHLKLSVSDTGRGIRRADLPNIFNRFYQTNQKNAAAEGGTGIGLALSKEFIQLMSGKIRVESELGQGSTFFVEFPRTEVIGQISDEAAEEVQRSKPALPPDPLKGGLPPAEGTKQSVQVKSENSEPRNTILLVEDNPDLRDFIKSLLEEDYEVLTAENGRVALEVMENNHKPEAKLITHHSSFITPNLIISDVMMPIMDGVQLLENLKSRDEFRHIPIIMLTAKAMKDDKLKALRIGVDDYMTKPFEEDELKARIENLLKNAEGRRLAVGSWQLAVQGQEAGIKNQESSDKKQVSKEDMEWLENLEITTKEKLSDFQFNVEYLSGEMFYSRQQLTRRIRQLTGLTADAYIREARLNQARFLLESGVVSGVKSASLEVGLRDFKHFSRLFKKRFGKLPSEYF